ncbi:MAG TPA: hypothetical protein VN325_35440 [Steroidobacteraceae bacterium]|nr:hypothetical protein [Steroidobacteraceae bacterium]
MSDINIGFCRALLRIVLTDIKPLTTPAERKDAWVYKCMEDHWEFHGPSGFYWHGSADNAYDARAKGWQAWMADAMAQRDALDPA